jgi:hypothetical protein
MTAIVVIAMTANRAAGSTANGISPVNAAAVRPANSTPYNTSMSG